MQDQPIPDNIDKQAVLREMRRRQLIDEEQLEQSLARYHWNETETPHDVPLVPPGFWETETNPHASHTSPDARLVPLHHLDAKPPGWLWPKRIPRGKVTLLTGQAGDGKSIVAADLIARVTTGAEWPDGQPNEPGSAILLSPAHGLRDIVLPRLRTAGVNLSLVHLISTVSAESEEQERFLFPAHGPLLEEVVRSKQELRLLMIDSLSEFLDLPNDPTTRQRHLQEVLFDLETLAETYDVAVVCVETVRPGGIVPLPHKNQWRADYDPTFKAVWGVARDPRDRQRRLLLPIRHHLGDDRLGFQFAIVPDEEGIAAVEWGDEDGSITFAEAIGRVRLGRSVWSFSQTAQAETWLRQYLAEGEKKSVEIFSDARKAGFSEYPIRNALRRIAIKSKQGRREPWAWKLLETD